MGCKLRIIFNSNTEKERFSLSLLVRFAGNESGQSRDGAESAPVRVDPLPLVVHTRSVMAAASSLSPQPEPHRPVAEWRRCCCRRRFCCIIHHHIHLKTHRPLTPPNSADEPNFSALAVIPPKRLRLTETLPEKNGVSAVFLTLIINR